MRARMSVALLWTALLPTLCGCGGNAGTTGGDKIDTSYIHPGFAAAVIVRPKQVLASPLVAMLPQEAKDDAMRNFKTETKLDPSKIEQVEIFLGPPSGGEEKDFPVSFGAVLRFDSPVDEAQVVKGMTLKAKQREFNGKKYYCDSKKPPEALYFPSDRMLVISTEPGMKKMLGAEQGSGPLSEMLSRTDAGHDLLAVGIMAPFKALVKRPAEEVGKELPPALAGSAAAPDQLKSAVLTADLNGEHLLHLSLEGNDQPSRPCAEKESIGSPRLAHGDVEKDSDGIGEERPAGFGRAAAEAFRRPPGIFDG